MPQAVRRPRGFRVASVTRIGIVAAECLQSLAMSAKSPSDPSPALGGSPTRWDPTYLHARREAIAIFIVWLAALAWTVPYSYATGYPSPGQPLETPLVWGMPAWVVGGVVGPWIIANVVTIVFCLGYFRLDPLGEDDQQADANPAAGEGGREP